MHVKATAGRADARLQDVSHLPRSQRRHATVPRVRAVLALSVLAAALAMPAAHAGSLLHSAVVQHRHIERALHRIEAQQEIHADRLTRKVARR